MFRCKQFAVQQDKCAMKVSTDSLLLGSWCQPENANSVLDIGTGTGILSLMLAQKSHTSCQITALEIDEQAAQQAQDNVQNSPWAEKIQILQQDFVPWSDTQQANYDLVISNPPWFDFAPSANHNLANQQRKTNRTVARQQSHLSLQDLFSGVYRCLTASGRFYFVLPFSAQDKVLTLVREHQFEIINRLTVYPTPEKAPYCQMWLLRKKQDNSISSADVLQDELCIRDSDGQYSAEYRTLCQDFYLNF